MDDREKIFNEIKETEQRYLNNLNILNKLYLQPMQRNAKSLGMVLTSDLKNIVSTLTIILNINTQLLTSLQGTSKDGVGSVFKKTLPFLKTYTSYFNSYEGASNDIRNAKKSNKKFAEWLDKTEKTAKKNGQLGLISYLIQPIQRIPRYSLLLNELLKNTDPTHADYVSLKQSLDTTKEVATHLDRAIEEMDNRAKMATIQRNLMTNDGTYQKDIIAAPHRKFLFDIVAFVLPSQVTATQQEEQEAPLSPESDVNPSTRYIFLFSDMIVVTRLSTKVEQMGYKSKKELRDNNNRNSIRRPQLFQSRATLVEDEYDSGIGPLYVVLDKISLTQSPLVSISSCKDFGEIKQFSKEFPNMFQISTASQTWTFLCSDESRCDKFIEKYTEGLQLLVRNPNYKLEQQPSATHQGYPEEVENFCISLIQSRILATLAEEEYKQASEHGSFPSIMSPRRETSGTDDYIPRHVINSIILSEYDADNEKWVDLSQGSVNLESSALANGSFRFRFIDFDTQKELFMVMTIESPINVDEEQLFHTWYIGEKYYALQVPNLKTSKKLEKFYLAETQAKENVQTEEAPPVEEQEQRELLASADQIVLLQHDPKATEWKVLSSGSLALFKMPTSDELLIFEFTDAGKNLEKRRAILEDGKLPKVSSISLLHRWNEQQALFGEKVEIAFKFSDAETSAQFDNLYDIVRRVQEKEVEEIEEPSNVERSITEAEPEEVADPVITKTEEPLEEEEKERKRLEQEEAERLEQERLEQQKLEEERLEKERLEKERLEKEEQERLEKEKKDKEDKERKQQEEKEREAKEKEERDREEKEKVQKELEAKEREQREEQARLAKIAKEEEAKKRNEELKQLRAKDSSKSVKQPAAVLVSPREEKEETQHIPEWKRRILEKKKSSGSLSSTTNKSEDSDELNVEGLAPWQIEILKKRKTLSAKVLSPTILSSSKSNLKSSADSSRDNISQLRNKFETGV